MNLNSNIDLKGRIKEMLKNSQELTFVIMGFLIFIVVIWYLISSINFLVKDFNKAFNIEVDGRNNENAFNIEGAKKIIETKISE